MDVDQARLEAHVDKLIAYLVREMHVIDILTFLTLYFKSFLFESVLYAIVFIEKISHLSIYNY